MAAQTQPQPQGSAFAGREGGGVLTQKIGPFATWVWLVIVTLVVGGIALYMRHKQGTQAQQAQAQPGQVAGEQQVPDIILQNYETQTVGPQTETVQNIVPPSQPGPPGPPGPAGPPGKTPAPRPKPKPPPHKRTAVPARPKPPAQRYTTVTVVKWTPTHTPWNSTLWGIATHYGVKGGYQELAKLNGIRNPDLIYPGQHIKVPIG